MREQPNTSPRDSHPGSQSTIVEETTPSEEVPLATHIKQDQCVDEVIQATKRLLECVRLRDFQGYK